MPSAPARTPTIHRLVSARYLAVVESARWREDARVRAARAGAIERCGAAYGTGAARLEELLSGSNWERFDETVGHEPLVVITVVPRVAFSARCAESPDAAFAPNAMFAAGIHVSEDTIAPSANDITTVELHSGDTPIRPALLGRVAMVRLAPDGYAGADGSHAVRLYLPVDALIPDTPEQPLTLRVWNASRVEPELIELPTSLVRALWRDLLPWRAARLRRSTAEGVPVPVPAPRDRGLAEAHAAYLSGQSAEGAYRVAMRLADEDVPRRDLLSAQMQLGLTFAGHRDSAATLAVFGEALEREPCLTLPAETRPEFLALLERARPVTRCEAVAAGRVLRLGLVPGRAQRRLYPERRGSGMIPALLTGGAAAASVSLYLRARDKAAAYRDARVDAAAAYAEATDARASANMAAGATYLLWGGSIVHALWKERQLARRSAAVRDYGAASGPAISVGAAAGGLGLAIHFF